MRLAIISDSHVPSRASEIPDWVRDEVQTADATVHAGDFDNDEALETVRQWADGELTAVSGNMDPSSLGLPRVATLSAEGVDFVVTHGTGSSSGYERRVAEIVEENGGDVGVSGHTHEVLDTSFDGVRLLNPGSCTGAWPADSASMMVADVEGGDLSVEVLEG